MSGWNVAVPVTPVTSGTTITVNGSTQNIYSKVGESFGDVVTEYARNANMGKFRVFVNGSELLPENAPTVIVAGSRIELKPYDVAGAK